MPMLTNLADVLRAYTAPDGSKLTVVETVGWKTRGYAGQGLAAAKGHMWHHTATAESAFAYADCPTLNLLINGRPDLPGPLCNIAFGRSGTVYVVAAGVANHAGPGSAGGAYANVGNFYFVGNEMESSGVRNDWTPAQIRIMPYVAAALERGYGGRDFMQIGHKEYSSMGKIDPAFIDMDAMRDAVNKILYSSSGEAPAASIVEKEWSDMATEKQVEDAAFRAATNAIKEWAATGFTRQGTRAAKAWKEGQTTNLNSILRWWDEAQLAIGEANTKVLVEVRALGQRLEALEKKTSTQSTSQAVNGATLDQLRAVVREEINKTTLGGGK